MICFKCACTSLGETLGGAVFSGTGGTGGGITTISRIKKASEGLSI